MISQGFTTAFAWLIDFCTAGYHCLREVRYEKPRGSGEHHDSYLLESSSSIGTEAWYRAGMRGRREEMWVVENVAPIGSLHVHIRYQGLHIGVTCLIADRSCPIQGLCCLN